MTGLSVVCFHDYATDRRFFYRRFQSFGSVKIPLLNGYLKNFPEPPKFSRNFSEQLVKSRSGSAAGSDAFFSAL